MSILIFLFNIFFNKIYRIIIKSIIMRNYLLFMGLLVGTFSFGHSSNLKSDFFTNNFEIRQSVRYEFDSVDLLKEALEVKNSINYLIENISTFGEGCLLEITLTYADGTQATFYVFVEGVACSDIRL